jgi:hypothetical protein
VETVAEERPIRLGIGAEHDHVRAVDDRHSIQSVNPSAARN